MHLRAFVLYVLVDLAYTLRVLRCFVAGCEGIFHNRRDLALMPVRLELTADHR